MTIEGVFIIIIFILLGLNAFSVSKEDWRSYFTDLKPAKFKFGIAYFFAAFLTSLLISEQIVGLIVINTIAWQIFYNNVKKQGYQLIAWWSLLFYSTTLFATYQTFEDLSNNIIWQISVLSWGLGLLFLLLFDIIKRPYKLISVLVSILLSLIAFSVPLTFILYQITFGVPIGEGQVNAILQSTISESKEFMEHNINLLASSIFLFTTFVPIVLLGKQYGNQTSKLSAKSFSILAFVALTIFNLDFINESPMIDMTFTSAKKYQEELIQFKKELARRKAGDIDFTATKKEGKELHVVIIGESHNKKNMGLYGYHRNTTPQLDSIYSKGDLIKFENAYSNHVHTVPVLTYSLTEANQINKKDYNQSLSIIDIQDAAGFETYWLSNQVAVGGWDNPVSVLANRVDHRFNFNSNLGLNNSTSSYDIDLVKKLDNILSDPLEQNTVIYLHLMGNHGNYKERYPKEFERFTENLQSKYFGGTNYWDEHVNEYDNSVLYTDFVISQIINSINNYNGISTCLYFADHSEDALNNKGHDAGNFNFRMIQTPMLLWLSEQFQDTYPEQSTNLKGNTNSHFSNGFVYDLLIGLNGITTDHYSDKNDLSNSNYSLPIEECLTLHGNKKLFEDDNFYYFETENIKKFKELNQSNRVYPHRINSLGKLNQILYDGCTSFELDLAFVSTKDSGYFEVGHEVGMFANMSFKEVLEATHGYEIERIWMDIKNLNPNNVDSVLTRLIELDQEFQLKSKAIVETSMTSTVFSIISNQDYNTSYYLPTGIKDKSTDKQKKEAFKIANQIKLQKTKAVSFDYQLYPFVKEYLEPLIHDSIKYHTWFNITGFHDPKVVEKITNQDFYNDARIETILTKYYSDYEL